MEISAIFYVCIIALSVMGAVAYLYFIVKKNNEDFSRAERMLLFAFPLSFVIGRIGYALLNFEEFRGNLVGFFLFWEGGVNLPVALISFFVLMFAYSEVHALKAVLWWDIFIIPLIFAAALHTLLLHFFYDAASNFFIISSDAVVLLPIGFTEGEFLQTPALFEGILTLILALFLTRMNKYDSGAIFFFGASAFFFIRFVLTFFYVVSVPLVFSFSHTFLLVVSVIFFALFFFTIKTQGR
ncbi:MAG: prolipoprotein diacylglyceryl transferase [Selenomonadaceae bacterium]|nr:prolipoprotein diacylglyceryl transferase [Selenomonadaceae bacterium]